MKLKINRSTFYDAGNKRLDILDSRYYFKIDAPDIFYPSVTTVLDSFPKGWALTQWHKALGFNADVVLARAAELGSHVHDAINKYLLGHKLTFGEFNSYSEFKENYTLTEWQMIRKFVEFWNNFKPRLIATEVTLISEFYKIGGTLDIVCEIFNEEGNVWERWIIDTKTGNSIYPSHEFQLSMYAKMWNEENPDYHIERAGILHLNADTRGPRKGRIQGEGWQIKEFDRHYGEAFKVFKHVRAIWDELNPNYKPEIYSMPTEFQLLMTEQPQANIVEPPNDQLEGSLAIKKKR